MISLAINWDEPYLRDAIADEIELAAVHPKVRCRVTFPRVVTSEMILTPDPPRYGSLNDRHSRTTPSYPIPRWRRTWLSAGPLIAELSLSVRIDDEEGTVSAGNGNRRRDVMESYANHPDKDSAILAAIVRAAIRVCTEARDTY